MPESRRSFLRNLIVLPKSSEQTLVVIFLRGGADTLNILVPYGDDVYYRHRPSISIAPPSEGTSTSAIRIDDFYGFHPALRAIEPIFKEGRLGLVQAVGSDNTSGSHFEAQDQIEHGESSAKRIGGGWLGRYLRSMSGSQTSPLSAVAIGSGLSESLRGAQHASSLTSLEELKLKPSSGDVESISRTLGELYGEEDGLLGEPGRNSLELVRRVESIRSQIGADVGEIEYPKTTFGQGLREISRLVKAHVGLQVACLDLNGWDTHFFQGGAEGLQAQSIRELGDGLAAFDRDLAGQRVTTIVMTEFGRRIYENGSLGTDHGRGFALMAMGSGVNGGLVYGNWPGLDEDDADILGPGGLKVQIDYRSVLAEVLSGALGFHDVKNVFPGYAHQKIGIS